MTCGRRRCLAPKRRQDAPLEENDLAFDPEDEEQSRGCDNDLPGEKLQRIEDCDELTASAHPTILVLQIEDGQ